MELALVVVWWSSALLGAVALIVALLSANMRRAALTTAAAGFFVAGVLGILSIGLLFIILAGLCAFAAARTSPAMDEKSPHLHSR